MALRIEPFTKKGELSNSITPEEVRKAVASLSNNKAPGPDGIQVELLKSAPPSVIEELVETFNNTFIQGQTTNIGNGTLTLLQKPGKPTGPPANLRPIVLLPVARKILSLITLNRIKEKVESYLSPSQAGFRQNRSTADIVWSHKWLISKVQKIKEEFTLLGIDMTPAFDTINRSKLIDICETFLEEDEIRIIRTLLSKTSLELLCRQTSKTIPTLVGSPQGDGLSPTLFIIYVEAALKEVRASIQINSQKSPSELSYADDVDFIFSQLTEAENNHNIIADTLAKWNLRVNKTKTEFTNISRTSEDWKDTKKLGSLLDTTSDIERRKNLATIAFRKMYTIWIRRNKISEERLLRLYKALILPILLYNSGTWATTKTIFEKLNAFHRKQRRNLLGIKWTDKISNEELYHRTKSQPMTLLITRWRWKLFRHILRRPIDIPANLAMKAYFDPSNKPGYRLID
ncbi:endonuclease-reverse transcriptase [Elysia marginata]|uniref:Endonuclease-reverse transcriptase n=1 Tax=Elysia marginata TaxID=1093978 RepID=A0AAV4IF99_9GAST|nr:endonuclease-reverse transcriptase [Elysia marginata]